MVGCRTIIGTIGGCGGLLALYRWEDSAVVPKCPLWWLDADAIGGRIDANGLLTTHHQLGMPGLGCSRRILKMYLFAAGLLVLWVYGLVVQVRLLEAGSICFLWGWGRWISQCCCPGPTLFRRVIRHDILRETAIKSFAFT